MDQKNQGPFLSVVFYAVAVCIAVSALHAGGHTIAFSARIAMHLALAGLIWLLGYRFFGGRFIRPRWKAVGKGIAFLTLSYLLLIWIDLWAWPLILTHQAVGITGHIVICRRYGINWVTIEPRQKYIALMEKWGGGTPD